MATVTQSRPPVMGQDHSYTINPAPGVGCEVVWSINGQAVGVGSKVGGLKVEGIGASGTLSVEVTGDISKTRVSAVINCPPPAAPNPAPAINVSDGKVAAGGGNGDEDDDRSLGDIILEVLKTLGLPASLPFWLLWLILFLIFKLLGKLGEVKPSPEDIKDILKKAGDLLPDWLRDLLDLK